MYVYFAQFCIFKFPLNARKFIVHVRRRMTLFSYRYVEHFIEIGWSMESSNRHRKIFAIFFFFRLIAISSKSFYTWSIKLILPNCQKRRKIIMSCYSANEMKFQNVSCSAYNMDIQVSYWKCQNTYENFISRTLSRLSWPI